MESLTSLSYCPIIPKEGMERALKQDLMIHVHMCQHCIIPWRILTHCRSPLKCYLWYNPLLWSYGMLNTFFWRYRSNSFIFLVCLKGMEKVLNNWNVNLKKWFFQHDIANCLHVLFLNPKDFPLIPQWGIFVGY